MSASRTPPVRGVNRSATGRWGPAAKASIEGAAEFGFNGGEAGMDQFAPGDHDDIYPWRELVMAEDLSNQSLRPVPDDRAPHLPRGGDAQPPDLEIVGEGEQGEELAVNLGAAVVDPLILGPATNAFGAGESGHRSSMDCGSDGT